MFTLPRLAEESVVWPLHILLASAGHTVTVLEAVAVPGEIGAGVQVASNVTRILTRWGLGSKLKEIAGRDKVESILINRYVNGETILRMPGGMKLKNDTGEPRGRKFINVAACAEDEDEAAGYSWSAQNDSDGMRAQFSGWESRVIKLLALVKSPHILKFKLMDCVPLETWVHAQGRVTLMGDACHPVLPYRAQGAAMAIEDAEVLGKLFSHVTHHKQIPSLLRAYESIRFERATTTQRRSTESREFWPRDGQVVGREWSENFVAPLEKFCKVL
ncbi:FAD/NAD(P)-binding domain-containing protein [Gymnopus androsaceus JB14]|uniref:FAD/NAD(P)-binding domain-containing protein n=1 Tax=Gymnopus androsaceus JB14 TaxID=1447944 RepID=A0A6A4II68_9AGAR|nr:FAD/NAD(P)-binding domain-containing protein [Gymnopus androsaceus JB14]